MNARESFLPEHNLYMLGRKGEDLAKCLDDHIMSETWIPRGVRPGYNVRISLVTQIAYNTWLLGFLPNASSRI